MKRASRRIPPKRKCGDCKREYYAWSANQPCPHCLPDPHLENRQTLAEMAREARLERRGEDVAPSDS